MLKCLNRWNVSRYSDCCVPVVAWYSPEWYMYVMTFALYIIIVFKFTSDIINIQCLLSADTQDVLIYANLSVASISGLCQLST